ncbi:hypothetical protein [Capnocytophaga sputigena]|uniref:hypothetical protein n=1 Tax=Capnocytophaga sputigena TaxID=1019 RepID=UPI0028D6C3C4|nr:hypothetical protein [Capnocytophaga sputigena]
MIIKVINFAKGTSRTGKRLWKSVATHSERLQNAPTALTPEICPPDTYTLKPET